MATEQQLMMALQKADAAGDTAGAQQFATMIKAQRAAPTPDQTQPPGNGSSGPDMSGTGGALYAAAHGLEDTATFGQGDKLAALLSTGVRRIAGDDSANYKDQLAGIKTDAANAEAAHPYANIAGDVGGVLSGGAEISAAGDVARALPKVGKYIGKGIDALNTVTRDAQGNPLTTGKQVANVLKSAAANAGVGGGVALANGQSLPQAAQTAAISGVAGPTVGKLADFALSGLAETSQKAYAALAKAVGETPQVLEQAINTFRQATGTQPSMAQLMGLKSQGTIKALASANADIGTAAADAANHGGQPLHVQLASLAQQSRPQTESELQSFRDSQMTKAMDAVGPQTGRALRDEPVSVNSPQAQAIMTDPLVIHALKSNSQKLGQDSLLEKIDTDSLTLNDVDQIRESLRNRQDVYANPQSAQHDRSIAKAFGDVANKVENIGVQAQPAYGDALNSYRKVSRYTTGFSHGLSGNAFADAPDTRSGAALKTAEGQAGYAHGNALYKGQQALNAIAPSVVKPEEQPGLNNAVHAAAAVASSNPIGMAYHAMRAIPGLHMSPDVQQIVAKQLMDPNMVSAAVANLRRGRASVAQIRQLGNAIGGAAGANVARLLSQQQGQ